MSLTAEMAQLETLRVAFGHVHHWSEAIDGGAYRGEWTAVMAERFYRVHAFEPSEDSIGGLLERFGPAGSVVIYFAALWNRADRVAIVPDPRHPTKAFGRYAQTGGN